MSSRPGPLAVAPALVVLALLVGYPALYMGWMSVTDGMGRWSGLEHFTAMAQTRLTGLAVRNTVVYVAGSIVLQLVLGTALGLLLDQSFRGRTAVRALVVIPWVVPGIVAATTWAWMLHTEFGIVNQLLVGSHLVGRPVGWLVEPGMAMPTLIAVNVWKQVPFVAVMVLASLQSVPRELYETARVDGASWWDEVRHVTLPGIRHVLVAVALLLAIWGLNAITLVYTMTRGGPANRTLIMPIHIFRQAFDAFQLHEAAALSVMFFACALAIVALYMRAVGAQGDRP